MGSRKVNTEGIDEELLLASIGRRTQDGTLRPAQEVPAAAPTEEDTAAPEPSPVQPVTREKAQRESGRRKRQDEDYNELFLRRNEIKTRQCVYISRDVHGKILRIVNDIAGGEISVGGYVDTVLRQHLEHIIRKTKCFDFWERNVLFPKTKRSFFRTSAPLPCPFPLNFSLLIITKKFGNLAKNRYICIV